MKKSKGITLVALVITIAIMLILAGVTISVSLKGGLFSRANEATSQMQIDIEKEQLLTAVLGTLGINGKVNLEELDSNLPTGFEKVGTGTYTSSTGNRYQVTEDADIILLDGTEEEPEIPDIPVTPPADIAIALSATVITKEITKGTPETVQITAELYNANGDLTWTSSDTSVAEISGSGNTRTITLKKAGTAVITISYGEIDATCNITITEKPISVILDKETINETIESGELKTVSLTATLNNASGNLTWSSSDTSVAVISGSGTTRTITLIKAGTATITVSYGNVSDTCTIVVRVISNKIITFTVGGEECTALEGMSWIDFVNSEYNTVGLKVHIIEFSNGDKYRVLSQKDEVVVSSDAVPAHTIYMPCCTHVTASVEDCPDPAFYGPTDGWSTYEVHLPFSIPQSTFTEGWSEHCKL